MKLLHVDSSILGQGSVSRELSALIVRRLTAGNADLTVTYRDLAVDEPAHMTLASLPDAHPAAAMAGPLAAAATAVRADSDRMLAEFEAADTVVIGAPMYNFTLPTQLKAWMDRLIVPGRTFRTGPNGVEGLAGGKRIIVAIARGGFYGADTGAASAEHAEALLRTLFGFIGITDPTFVLAEGLTTGEHGKANALAQARAAIDALAA